MFNQNRILYDVFSKFDDFDESITNLDFSEIRGKKNDFKNSFKNANNQIEQNKLQKKQSNQSIFKKRNQTKINQGVSGQRGLQGRKVFEKIKNNSQIKKQELNKNVIPVRNRANISPNQKKISRILVPDDKNVIVEGVSKFILSQKPGDVAIKNIGYYKGQKLKELVLIFNNITPNPFTIELFNPSAPLDYLYNTSQNLNNKIIVNGGSVAYSDILFNLLANPTLIPNCKFTFAGANINAQKAIPLSVIDRDINGEEFIQPLNIDLTIDNMQVQGDVTFFDISQKLNRPYIPDGMDTIKYTVLPNMSVIMAFFYYQKSIKKAFFEEARIENSMKER